MNHGERREHEKQTMKLNGCLIDFRVLPGEKVSAMQDWQGNPDERDDSG